MPRKNEDVIPLRLNVVIGVKCEKCKASLSHLETPALESSLRAHEKVAAARHQLACGGVIRRFREVLAGRASGRGYVKRLATPVSMLPKDVA